MNPHYPLVAQRAAHHCEYCRAPEAVFNFPFEVEHVIPPARGGLDIESNWALSCRSCNLYKSIHVEGTFPGATTLVRLFDPRRDIWAEHFRVTAEDGRIIGVTDVGRATVTRLQMNTPAQLQARQQWIRLRLFPGEL
jgi:hypothetical protein